MRLHHLAGRAAGFDRPRVRVGGMLVRGAIALSVIVGSGLIAAPARADATRDAQWYLKTLKVAEAHKLSQGEGITVAVIDTGVDANHPDLRGNVLPGINALDVNSPDKGTKDVKGHGTAMASLIAGHGHGPGNTQGVLGIAPKAKILPINVSSSRSSLVNTDMIADAITYAARQGAQVICVALSGGLDHKQGDAIDEARERGALVIAAAGNHSEGDSTIGWPAYYTKAVAVNTVGKDNKLDKEAVEGATMDIAAPGADITMAKPGGGYFTSGGSSPATAIVAGAAALIRAKYPDSGSNLFLNRLLLNATDQGAPGQDEYYGWGTLDLIASLTKEPPRLTPSPSPTDLVLPEHQEHQGHRALG